MIDSRKLYKNIKYYKNKNNGKIYLCRNLCTETSEYKKYLEEMNKYNIY
ncbi:MAG: hypothetical protein ABEK36_05235 [Candidatus Aenigmatarchaeota archaeon]